MKKIYLLLMIGLITTPIQAQWTLLGQDIDGSVISDWYGSSTELSSDGNTVVVGATGTDFNGNNSGTIAVFNWNGSAWIQVGNNVNGEAANDQFGVSTSISSDAGTIAGGAFGNDQNGSNSGHVRVFEWNGSSWIQKGLDIDGDSTNDHAGWVISLSSDGSSVAIGIPDNDGNGADAGMARIYDWNGVAWVQKGLDIVGDFAGDRIGFSIDLSENGNTVIVGARYNDQNGVDAGLVKIYSWNGSSWVLKGSPIVGKFAGDNCGSSVSLSANADTLAIGAIANDGLAPNAGHVRVFYWSGIAWVQLGNDIDGVLNSEWMGWSVSLSANGAIIATGAMYQGGGGWSNDGLARIYSWNGSAWIQDGSDINSEGSTPDYSATCISLSAAGDRVAIGAPGNTGPAPATGHVRIFYNYTCNSTYSFSTSECNSYTVPSGDEIYTALGTYTVMDTIPNMSGCDSLMTIDVTINSPSAGTDTQTACDSYTWIDGNTYNASNSIATHTLTNAAGCDSVVTLNLSMSFSNTSTDVQTACDSYTWINGNTYNASNSIATHTLTNLAGCDSVVTLNLSMSFSNTGTDVQTACDSYTWINGNTYNASNSTATHTLTNLAGCDSIVTLNLSMSFSNTGTDVQTACDTYTWMDGNIYTASNNVATWTLVNASGCDSVVTLDLTINTVNTSVTQVDALLTADESGATTYQWLDCSTMTQINGANSQAYTATTNGDYAVIVTINGCSDTSACYTVTGVGIIENDFGSGLLLYPNPTDGYFSIDLGDNSQLVTVTMTDLSGKFIQSKTYSDEQLLNLKIQEPAGVYLLVIESGDKKAIIRLVKE
jgi:hypothetical protein